MKKLISAPVDKVRHSNRLSLQGDTYRVYQDEQKIAEGQISKDFSGFDSQEDDLYEEDYKILEIMKDPKLKKQYEILN